MEKKLTDDKVVFVKAQGWDDANRIVDNLRRQLAQEASAQTDERTLCCDPHRLYHAIPVSDTSATSVDPFVLGKRDKDRAGAPETSGKDDEPMSLLESADRDLRSGLAAKAIQEYQDHLKSNPEDGAAMRSLGVALMQSRRAAEGVAKISAAYEMDPTLAARPLDASALNDGDTVLRDLVPAAVAQAHRARSGGPWIAVAALMQAQGRTEAAARMVARAKENGAPEKVIAEFALALEGALASREVAK
jgi:tetratricopeptide (TPR) repeat protein